MRLLNSSEGTPDPTCSYRNIKQLNDRYVQGELLFDKAFHKPRSSSGKFFPDLQLSPFRSR